MHQRFDTLIKDFERELDRAERLVAKANRIHDNGNPSIPKFQLHQIIELSFMQSYLAWEMFLEDAFMLYIMGKPSPSGFAPVRRVAPTSLVHAVELVRGDSTRPLDWTATELISSRAERCFRNGAPFTPTLQAMTTNLQDMKTLRNAVSHASGDSQAKFRSLVRRKLNHYPQGLAPGGLLNTPIPASAPPVTFLGEYLSSFRLGAKRIVR